ncbi:MAG: hypothetical protein WC141_01355 [Arcobacteraceae bacterium]
MIVAVKRTNYTKLIVKIVAFAAVVALFTVYYFQLSEKFKGEEVQQTPQDVENVLKEKRASDIETVIFDEAQIAIELIAQDKIRTIKVIGRKLYIATDPDASLDALMVRYGVMALVKTSVSDIKIAIDLKQIVESKYNVSGL